jgi:hypothetical protein
MSAIEVERKIEVKPQEIIDILKQAKEMTVTLPSQDKIDERDIPFTLSFKFEFKPVVLQPYFQTIETPEHVPTKLFLKYTIDKNLTIFYYETTIQEQICSKSLQKEISPPCPRIFYTSVIKKQGQPFNHDSHFIDDIMAQKHTRTKGFDDYYSLRGYFLSIGKNDVYSHSEYYHTIVLMEEIIGTELFKLYNKRISQLTVFEVKIIRIIVLYLSTLLTLLGYFHGDLHLGNVMLSNSESTYLFEDTLKHSYGITHIPYIIDFGRTFEVSNFKFDTLDVTSISKLTTSPNISNFYKELYETASKKSLIEINYYVNELLDNQDYTGAMLVLTMCCDRDGKGGIDGISKSMLKYALEYNSDVYNYLFSISEEESKSLNELIEIQPFVVSLQTTSTDTHKRHRTSPPSPHSHSPDGGQRRYSNKHLKKNIKKNTKKNNKTNKKIKKPLRNKKTIKKQKTKLL